MFWLYLQFSHECFVMSQLLVTCWWIHSTFNDDKPHIRLSWQNKNIIKCLFSKSDCHTVWEGSINLKMDTFSKIALANWIGRVSGGGHKWQRINCSCLLDLLLANSFLRTQYPLFAFDWCMQFWLSLLTWVFSMYYSYSCITNCGTRCSRLGSLSP